MKKQKPFDKFTYLEKITMLFYYYESNKTLCIANACLAKKMCNIIHNALDLNDVTCLEIIDEILNKFAVIKTAPHFPKEPYRINGNGPWVLAEFKPTIVCFNPNKDAFDKIDILVKYINHELNKKKQNTVECFVKE